MPYRVPKEIPTISIDAIWAHAVRTLTNLADVRAAKIDNLDATMSSRLSKSDFDIKIPDVRAAKIDNLDATMSSRLSKSDFDIKIPDVRAAKIDNLDALLSSRLAKSDFDTAIATLLTKAYFDTVVGARTDDPDVATLFSAINALGMEFLMASEITPGNVETAALEVLQSDDPKYEFRHCEGYTDLSPMQAGDTVVVKEYTAILGTPVTYRLYATHTYNGVQAEPLVHFTKKDTHVAWKITLQQTAGVNRQFRSVAYYRRIY